jgi:hypothetical protein
MPMIVQLENIPGNPVHQHIDLIYIARPKTTEVTDGKWITIEEMSRMGIEEEIIEHAKLAIKLAGY